MCWRNEYRTNPGTHSTFHFHEENSHLWVQMLSASKKSPLRQPSRDRLSHSGTTTQGHTACRGRGSSGEKGISLSLPGFGVSAAAYSSLIQSEVHCPVSVIIMMRLPEAKYSSFLANPSLSRKAIFEATWTPLPVQTIQGLSQVRPHPLDLFQIIHTFSFQDP